MAEHCSLNSRRTAHDWLEGPQLQGPRLQKCCKRSFDLTWQSQALWGYQAAKQALKQGIPTASHPRPVPAHVLLPCREKFDKEACIQSMSFKQLQSLGRNYSRQGILGWSPLKHISMKQPLKHYKLDPEQPGHVCHARHKPCSRLRGLKPRALAVKRHGSVGRTLFAHPARSGLSPSE